MSEVEQAYAAFTAIAREYCSTLESPANSGAQGLPVIRDILLRLYHAATQLPPVSLHRDDRSTSRDITHEQWQAVYNDLQNRLPHDYYWVVFNPIEEPADMVVGSIADDLADVWRDLKNGLLILGAEPSVPVENVWWKWRFDFHSHWGSHAIDALRAMHYVLRDV